MQPWEIEAVRRKKPERRPELQLPVPPPRPPAGTPPPEDAPPRGVVTIQVL